jgi:hypothetical protein
MAPEAARLIGIHEASGGFGLPAGTRAGPSAHLTPPAPGIIRSFVSGRAYPPHCVDTRGAEGPGPPCSIPYSPG